MKALATDELTKDYAVGFWRKRPYRALDRLSLEVEPGEVFGFLGPNGAGKTTTLKLLMQLVFPTSGRAEIFGRPVGESAVKRRLGYLPENPYFYDYLTAEELLTYFAGLFGYGPAERRARASRLLDEVGIGRERRLQLRKFSKGMLQRVGIAQALINDPELVIFDEPMSGLDPLGRREVCSLILRLRDRGCTVFFSSHVLSDAEALCSRVAILAKGRLMKSGRLADMLDLRAQGWELVVDSVTGWTGTDAGVTRAPDHEDQRGPLHRRASARPASRPRRAGDRRRRRNGRFAEPAARDARGPLRRAGRQVRGPRMRTIGWIAVNVFRESVRDKVLYNLVLFAMLMIGAGYLLGQLTAGQDYKIVIDLGLGAMSLFGLFIAVFIGIGLVSKEVERQSIYGLLAKPIHRYQLVLGKYVGLDPDARRERQHHGDWPLRRDALRRVAVSRGFRRHLGRAAVGSPHRSRRSGSSSWSCRS